MTSEAAARPRLNPFAFVSDTSLRFALLVVLVACASVGRWYGIASTWFGFRAKLQACLGSEAILNAAMFNGADLGSRTSCYGALAAWILPAVAIGLALLVAATVAIYTIYPVWQVRRLQLARLQPGDNPALEQALEELCRSAGLTPGPEFWWNVLDARPVAIAFGRRRRYRVALSGGVALQCFTDPAAFGAVLLHELAHIRNGDVGSAYLSLSIWWAFLLTALLPGVVVDFTTPFSAPDLLFSIAQLGLLAACVLLSRNAVLRARELYADARSFGWHRDPAALERLFRALAPSPRLRRWLSPHPEPARRRRLIENTDEMFRFGTWEALGIGVGAGFVAFLLTGLVGFAATLLMSASGGWITMAPPLIVALVVVPITAGAIAAGAWRSTFLSLMRGDVAPGKLRIAFGCAAGLVVGGLLLALASVVLSAAHIGSAAGLTQAISAGPLAMLGLGLLFVTAIVVVLTVALAALLGWIEAFSLAWLAVALPRARPGRPYAVGLCLCLISAAVWSVAVPAGVAVFFLTTRTVHVAGPIAVFWLGGIVADTPPLSVVAWPSLIALWALPLSAALFRRPAQSQALNGQTSWAFESAATASLPTVELFPGRAALAGIGGGILATVAMTWLTLSLSLDSLAGAGLPATPAAVGVISRLISGAAATGLIAFVVAAATPRLPIIHALCAGWFASVVIGTGEVIRLRLLGWHQPLPVLIDLVVPHVVFGGAAAALLGAVLARCVVAIARSAGRRRLRPQDRVGTSASSLRSSPR